MKDGSSAIMQAFEEVSFESKARMSAEGAHHDNMGWVGLIPFRSAERVVLKYRHRGVGVEDWRRQERQKGSVCLRRSVITYRLVVGNLDHWYD